MEQLSEHRHDSAPSWTDSEGSSVPAYLRKNKAERIGTPDTFMPLGMEQAAISSPSELDKKFAIAKESQRSEEDQERAKSILQSIETPVQSNPRLDSSFDDTSPSDKHLTYIQKPQPRSIFGTLTRFNTYLEKAVKRVFR